jgi:hypothetical protein
MMKRLYYIVLWVIGNFSLNGRIVVDELLAVFPAPTGNILILQSDMRPSLDEQARTFYEVACEAAMICEAARLHMTPTPDMLEAMIAGIQKRFGRTHEQLASFFLERGFTFEDGCELLKRRKMIEDLVSTMVRPAEPTKEQILDYYQSHLEYEDAQYTVRLAFISHQQVSRAQLEKMIDDGSWDQLSLEWDEAETYRERNLHPETKFVMDLKPGQIIIMHESEDGYDLVQLVSKTEKRPLPMDEITIGRTLKQEWFDHDFKVYQEKLLKGAHIYYCVPGLSLEPVNDVV